MALKCCFIFVEMKFKLIPLILFIVWFSGCRKSLFNSDQHTLNHDGVKRSYLLHLPTDYDHTQTNSLIIALHGGTGSAKNIEEQSGLADFSDEKGFILCSPNGLNRTWNAGWCCGKANENGVDDVGFISKLIDELIQEHNIDPKRVYVTGMSNGAFMTYRLACEITDKIAAIAPVAGTMNFNQCEPSGSMNIIHFHSYLDSNVPYLGGVGDGISDHYNSPLDSVFNFWAIHNNAPIKTETANDQTFDYTSWTGGPDSSEVLWYMSHDGGHSWPMGTAPTRNSDAPSTKLNANELMWDFFQKHPKN